MSGVTISVRVRPHSRRDEIVAMRNGVVVVRVTAPPRDGRTNDALRRLLAGRFGVPPSTVTIIRGQRSRDKLVRIDDVDQGAVHAALAS